jgi:hypothetical protein
MVALLKPSPSILPLFLAASELTHYEKPSIGLALMLYEE